MTDFVVIQADDARKLCDRLVHDASWDKAGSGYYQAEWQLRGLREAKDWELKSADELALMKKFHDALEDRQENEPGRIDSIKVLKIVAREAVEKLPLPDTLDDVALFIVRNADVLKQAPSLIHTYAFESIKRAIPQYLIDRMHHVIERAFVDQFYRGDDFDARAHLSEQLSNYLDKLENSLPQTAKDDVIAAISELRQKIACDLVDADVVHQVLSLQERLNQMQEGFPSLAGFAYLADLAFRLDQFAGPRIAPAP